MKVTMIISMYTYSTRPLGIGSEMKVSLEACHHKNLPHFPSVSQNCRSLSNCSCPITFAGSLSTDGISGTSQSTQQCRAILTKTHTHTYTQTHTSIHTLTSYRRNLWHGTIDPNQPSYSKLPHALYQPPYCKLLSPISSEDWIALLEYLSLHSTSHPSASIVKFVAL